MSPSAVPELDGRNGGLPIGATPAPPPIVTHSSPPHRDHPLITVVDVQNMVDAMNANGRQLAAATELFHAMLDIGRRQLEATHELVDETRAARADTRELLDFFVGKKTNGSSEHIVEPEHAQHDRERR